ncbi:MAG: restriction endonuclease subunit S [Bacteroidales bacterium]|nr:restriction endonuclease subunit S [Bacteroidales bacterium]
MRIPINDEIRQTMQGNIPYYGANGVQGYIDKYIFDEDLILLAEDGGNFEEYHTKPIAYKISGKSWVNNHAHILRAKQDFNQNYIFYSLVHKNITKYLNSGTRSKLNRSELEKIEIDFPETKGEEDKIADILSTCDAVIEKTQAAIAKYKLIKQGMLHDLFTRGIDIQTGKLRPRYKDAPELYKESKLGWIPKEWECEMLSSVIEIISGGTPSTQIKEYWGGEIPWLSVDDFNTGNRYASKAAKKITEEGLKNSATNMLLPGMLIISARGTVGVIAQMKAPMAFNQSCYGLNTVNEYLSNDFLYYYQTFFIRFIGFKSYGSVFDVITKSSFDEVFIPINKKSDEQRMIVEKLTAIDTNLQSEQSYLEKMQQLKKGLMEDLLSGKKRVKV